MKVKHLNVLDHLIISVPEEHVESISATAEEMHVVWYVHPRVDQVKTC